MKTCLPALAAALCAALAQPAFAKDENVARNAGFEEKGDPPRILVEWDHFSSKMDNVQVVDTVRRSGDRCVRLACQGVKGAHLGLGQTFDVVPKGKYTFRVQVLNDKDDKLGGDAVGNIGIEWYDAEGGEIGRAASKEWDGKLSKMSWQEYEVESKAPPFATKVKFVIYLRDGPKGGKGAIFVDDAEIVVK